MEAVPFNEAGAEAPETPAGGTAARRNRQPFNEAGAEAPETLRFEVGSLVAAKPFNEAGAEAPETRSGVNDRARQAVVPSMRPGPKPRKHKRAQDISCLMRRHLQ